MLRNAIKRFTKDFSTSFAFHLNKTRLGKMEALEARIGSWNKTTDLFF